MIQTVTVGSTEIVYYLTRNPRLRSVRIIVDLEHGVQIHAPDEVTVSDIENLVRRKASWIFAKLDGLQQIHLQSSTKEFIAGEKFPYLGRQHTLIIEPVAGRKSFVVMRNSQLIARIPISIKSFDQRSAVRNALKTWYEAQAKRRLVERVTLYERLLGVVAEQIEVTEMQKRWGSCTPQRKLRFDWRVIMAPLSIVDYLVVHELSHLRIDDHSPRFWTLVASILPDYEARREWLRVHGPLLSL